MEFESIVCRKCTKKLRPPFAACEKGHLVCLDCENHQNIDTNNSEDVHDCIGVVFKMTILDKMFRNCLDYCQHGCGLRTNLLDLKNHETECAKRETCYNCAIPECTWAGSLKNLEKHFYDNHPENLVDLSYLSMGEDIKITANNTIKLLKQYSDLYWVRYKNRHILILFLGQIDDDNNEEPQIKEFSISLKNITITSAVLECVETQNIDINDEEYFKNKSTNLSALKGSSFGIKIPGKTSVIPEKVSSLFSCVICTGVMYPPIRQCVAGHSFCENCIQKMKHCAICRLKITTTRNYILEELCEIYGEIRCENYVRGCEFVAENSKMKIHVKKCEYKSLECIFCDCKCKSSFKNIANHFEEAHKDFIYRNGTKITAEYSNLKSFQHFHFLYNVFNNNFVLTRALKNGYYYFNVYHVTYKIKTDFKFDLEFMHPTTNDRVKFSKSCEVINKKFNFSDNICRLPTCWFDEPIVKPTYNDGKDYCWVYFSFIMRLNIYIS